MSLPLSAALMGASAPPAPGQHASDSAVCPPRCVDRTHNRTASGPNTPRAVALSSMSRPVFAAHVLALLACGLLPSVVADAQIATEEQQQRQQPSLPPLDTRWAVGAPAALWPPPPETQTSSFGSSRHCCHCWLTLLVSPVPHSLCLQKERRIAPAALCCCRRVWTAHPRFACFPCPPPLPAGGCFSTP